MIFECGDLGDRRELGHSATELSAGRVIAVSQRFTLEIAMSHDAPLSPVAEGLEPPADGASVIEQATEGIKQAAHGVGVVYEQARKPGMPLSILANIAREAPLGSLFAAFLLGLAFARRR